MKATDLIVKLSHLVDEHGDLDVLASDFGCGCCGDLDTPDPHIYELDRYDLVYLDTTDIVAGTKVIKLNY